MSPLKILDTEIDAITLKEVVALFDNALCSKIPQLFLATVNPEILLHAHRHRPYREVLQRFSLRLADGVGVKLIVAMRGKKMERLTGRRLLQTLLQLADQKKIKVFIALNRSGLTDAAAAELCLKTKYPGAEISVKAIVRSEDLSETVAAEIVVAGLGAPWQEEWLERHRAKFSRARVLLGVGGAVDVLCGRLPAPPNIIAAIGLEWLWRLMIQPKRLPRILRAVVVFPLTVLFHRWLH
ncbi:WecB/TagA/CpsF family glycosyltransferase [Patescibacteria group bacterium]|nr:MAG: WecB/TagA/CpsF family glycosyltransferase [Patescibacteria group bacterium]